MPKRDPLQAALDLADTGFFVFPLHSPVFATGEPVRCTCKRGDKCGNDTGKHPRVLNYAKAATKSHAVIRGWFAKWPDANVAVLTGERAGIIVIDVDPRNGGDDTLSELEARLGRLPRTVEAITGGGGRHLFFRHFGINIPTRSDALGSGVDIKADGNNGYVVGAGSLHRTGSTYSWELSSVPGEVAIAELPPAWQTLIADPPGDMGKIGETGNTADAPRESRSSTIDAVGGASSDIPNNPSHPQSPCGPSNPCSPYRPYGIPITVEELIEQTLPKGPGEHDRAMMSLARGLKINLGMTFEQAEPIFERWFERALPNISNQDYEFSQDKFVRSWDWAAVPYGLGTTDDIIKFAETIAMPPEASLVRSLRARHLIPFVIAASVLRSHPFIFSNYEGATALTARGYPCDPKEVHNWLHRGLVPAGILLCVDRGRPGLPGKGAARWQLLIPYTLPPRPPTGEAPQ